MQISVKQATLYTSKVDPKQGRKKKGGGGVGRQAAFYLFFYNYFVKTLH